MLLICERDSPQCLQVVATRERFKCEKEGAATCVVRDHEIREVFHGSCGLFARQAAASSGRLSNSRSVPSSDCNLGNPGCRPLEGTSRGALGLVRSRGTKLLALKRLVKTLFEVPQVHAYRAGLVTIRTLPARSAAAQHPSPT